MSRRALKRLEELGGPKGKAKEEEEEEDDDEEEDAAPVRAAPKNAFSMLLDDDDDDDDDDDEEEEEEEKPKSPQKEAVQVKEAAASAPSKKKKNKKKKKEKSKDESEEDDDEALLAQLPAAASRLPAAEQTEQLHGEALLEALLKVDVGSLNPDKEMRRLFGAGAMAEERGNRAGAARGRGGRGHGAGRVLKKSSLVTPKDTWPALQRSGISMRACEAPEHKRGAFFELSFDADYMQGHALFLAMVATHDPQNVLDMLQQHPWNLEALLQMSEMYSSMGEQQQAADMLERCLYALEAAFPSSFTSALGSVRVDYRADTNKVLFAALFRQLLAVGRRGCARTATELAKLLLSLAPDEDPLGVLLCIDHYALRSKAFGLVLELEAFYRNTPSSHPHHHAPYLANFMFSSALAAWNLGPPRPSPSSSSPSPSSPPTTTRSAEDLLRAALRQHPAVLPLLLEKACVVQAGAIWGRALAHPMFRDARAQLSDTSTHLHMIFVERNLALWKAGPVLEWLRNATAALLDAIESGHLSAAPPEPAPPLPAGLYRHIVVSNFSDAMTTIPREALEEAQHDVGMARAARGPPPRQPPANPLDPNAHPLALFFQSLMPWNDAPLDGQPRPPPPAGEGPRDPDEDEALAWALQEQELHHDSD